MWNGCGATWRVMAQCKHYGLLVATVCNDNIDVINCVVQCLVIVLLLGLLVQFIEL